MQDPYYSFGKLIDYVRHVVIEPMVVDMGNGKTEEYLPSEKFFLSPVFFRGDNCYRSGRCCRPYDVSWTLEDFKRQVVNLDGEREIEDFEGGQELLDTGFEYEIQVNGQPVKLFIDPMTNKELAKKKQCDQLRYDDQTGLSYCAIRDINSITCRMPHSVIKYYSNRNSTYFQKQQFGRNHMLQCPVKWSGFSKEGLLETDIPLLERLSQTAQDMGVETIIPSLLQVIWEMVPKLEQGLLPQESIYIPVIEDDVQLDEVVSGIKWSEKEPVGFLDQPTTYNAVFIPMPKVQEN